MRRASRTSLLAAAGVAGLALAYGAWAGLLGDNLRVVDPGRYYRSGRMDGDDLRRTIHELGIRRVINLCGGQTNKTWYDEELAVCAAENVQQDDLRVSPRGRPSHKVLRRLFEAFDEGPYPMLIHCGGGADRAGFAAALYEVAVKGADPLEASDRQLTWRFGHIPVGGHEELDRFFESFAEQPAGTDIRAWALEEYDDGR